MDRIVNIWVNGNYVTKDNKNAGVRGEYNATYTRITFDEGWDGYAKTITWFDAKGGNPVKRVLTTELLEDLRTSARVYLLPIPGEALAEAGNCSFVVDGYVDGVRQRSVQDEMQVKWADDTENAGDPADPTPTQAEQLQSQIDQIMGDLQKAASAADAAEAAENSAKAAADSAKEATDAADAAGKSAGQAETSKGVAETAANRAEAAVVHAPKIGESSTWLVWDAALGAYVDTGYPATALVNTANGERVDVWFGTLEEYNKLETIENGVLYHILEGEIRV